MRPSALFIIIQDVGQGFGLASQTKYLRRSGNPKRLPYRIEISHTYDSVVF